MFEKCSKNVRTCPKSSMSVSFGYFLDSFVGCNFFALVWSFLLTAEPFCSQLCLGAILLTIAASLLTVFCLQLSFFAYNGKMRLTSTSMDSKQRSSTVSKQAPTEAKKTFPHFFGVWVCRCFCLATLSFKLFRDVTWHVSQFPGIRAEPIKTGEP